LPSESEQNVEAKAVEKPPAPPTSPNVESPMDPVKGVANSIDNYLAGATPKVSPTAPSNVNAASTPSSPPSAGALPGSETPLPSSGVAHPGSDAPLPGGGASPPSSGGTLPFNFFFTTTASEATGLKIPTRRRVKNITPM
jgi:hypothetical protein